MTIPEKLSWLMQPHPHQHLAALRRSGELAALLPEVDRLYGVPQNPEHHPEVCTGLHTELCLARAEDANADFAARFAVLVHDLGKGLTPVDELPKHVDHETRGLLPVREVCLRFNLDENVTRLALLVCEWHLHAHRTLEMRSTSLLKMTEATGLETDRTLRMGFIAACRADALGRLGKENRPYYQGQLLEAACEALEAGPPATGAPLTTREGQLRHNERLRLVRPIRAHYVNLHAQFKAGRI